MSWKFEIENWFDIPRALDGDGNQRKDTFAFVLKNPDDKVNISENDILQLSDSSLIVIESFYTISGIIYSVLACGTSMLDVGTMLVSANGKSWQITKNGFVIGRPKDEKLQKRVAENCWFQYKLQAINHIELPQTGVELRIIKNDTIV